MAAAAHRLGAVLHPRHPSTAARCACASTRPGTGARRIACVGFDIAVQGGGQARVGWSAEYVDRPSGAVAVVEGHIEVRWTHRRFRQPPEAKVYLDTPHDHVPGYHPLDCGEQQSPTAWRPDQDRGAEELEPSQGLLPITEEQ